MKATGIVRRIDDLGRVVIPKEIRRTMRIREGDPLEIYTDKEGEVIFKKYSPMGEMANFAVGLCDSMAKTSGRTVLITDRDSVVAVSGLGKKELLEKRLTEDLEHIMESRQIWRKDNAAVPILKDSDRFHASIVAPIVAEGDVSGAVVFLHTEGNEASDIELKMAQTVATFLSRQMEG